MAALSTSVQRLTCIDCGGPTNPKSSRARPLRCVECRKAAATADMRRYRLRNSPRGGPKACEHCGTEFDQPRLGSEQRFCSRKCRSAAYKPKPKPPKPKRTPEEVAAINRAQRSPIRAAFEDGDYPGLVAALLDRVVVSDDGCWLWQGQVTRDGYPKVKFGAKSRTVSVHRIALEARLGSPLGALTAHHKCATPACVNPDHLEAATHRANVGEMFARQSYERRIAELEAALRSVAPTHPALSTAPIRLVS